MGPKRVLLTYGATQEPIDAVRFITNVSTGKTGAFLADFLSVAGFLVTALRGVSAAAPSRQVTTDTFTSFSDLDSKLRKLLQDRAFDAVIHLAAVSDYSVSKVIVGRTALKKIGKGKISSDSEEVTLKLKRNHKIVNRIKRYAKESFPTVVAFKLTHTNSQKERKDAIDNIARSPMIDYVVHNDLLDIQETGKHTFTVYKGEDVHEAVESKEDLARVLREILRKG